MREDNNKTSYRQIFKASGILGGIQIITMLLLMVRSKFVALYLGPEGYGVSALFLSTISTIGGIIGLGITFSAIKDISSANAQLDKRLLNKIIIAFRRWIWLIGIMGTIVTFMFSKQLSLLVFKSEDYTYSFILLSIVLLFNSLSNGQKTLLQGLGKVKIMAKVALFSSLFGLIAIPIYYFWRLNGIVPAIIIASALPLFLIWYYSKEIKFDKVNVTTSETFHIGIKMVKMGILVTLSGYLYSLGLYLLNIFINRISGPNDVGLFQAGWSITGQFSSIVFGAMSMDYFPRLSSFHSDNDKISEIVNKQAEITLLIITPVIVSFVIFVPFVIEVLLAKSFMQIVIFVRLLALGLIIKTPLWCLGFILLAKGSTNKYIMLDLMGNTIVFAGLGLGYLYLKLNGIGIAFYLGYLIFLLIYIYAINRFYKIALNLTVYKFLSFSIAISGIVFGLSFIHSTISLIISLFLGLLSIVFSFNQLNKRLKIRNLVMEIYRKYFSKD